MIWTNAEQVQSKVSRAESDRTSSVADLAAKHGKGDALLDVAVAVDGGRDGASDALPCTVNTGNEWNASLVSTARTLSEQGRGTSSVR
jgi:hypothetical protein